MPRGDRMTRSRKAGWVLFDICHNAVMDALPGEMVESIVRLLADALQPEAIYLFGSHAYGTPHRHSDIDLLILMGDTEEPPVSLSLIHI